VRDPPLFRRLDHAALTDDGPEVEQMMVVGAIPWVFAESRLIDLVDT
jgi:hypothetical protein